MIGFVDVDCAHLDRQEAQGLLVPAPKTGQVGAIHRSHESLGFCVSVDRTPHDSKGLHGPRGRIGGRARMGERAETGAAGRPAGEASQPQPGTERQRVIQGRTGQAATNLTHSSNLLALDRSLHAQAQAIPDTGRGITQLPALADLRVHQEEPA
jgi:hypothetical protein